MAGHTARQASQPAGAGLTAAGEIVKRQDPDRFLTALFAPAEKRGTLLLLYAFNHELARAREVASEPPVALIRLHWWREVIEGTFKRHPIAEPLRAAIASGELNGADLLAMVDAREPETDPAITTTAEWRDYLRGTAGGLAVAAGRLLGASDPEALRPLGAAYGAAGVLRSARTLARHGRCLLPEDCLARHGLSPEAVTLAPESPDLAPVLVDLAGEGRTMLRDGASVRVERTAIAAVLPAVLAGRDLHRIAARSLPASPGPRGLGDRLAVTAAALFGKLPAAGGR
ncbi:MAG: squalene/phytoene synthase family protein [Acetobacteraceae bacterium]|nr:squalene/phytoene synthase family protein [Acetobacteraceae bacterium]